MTMRKGKKGPRYVHTGVIGGPRGIEDTTIPASRRGLIISCSCYGNLPRVVDLLNAGERAKAKVKRLKAELEHLRSVAGTYCCCKVCTR
jgi:hypothetical protein